MRILRMNSMYNFAFMFKHMPNLLYVFFGNFYITPLPLIAAGREWGPWEHLSILTTFCRIEIAPKNHATNC